MRSPLDKYPIPVYNIPVWGILYGKGKTMDNEKQPETCHCAKVGDGEKRTLRPEEEKRKLIHRLNRIEGQIRGIRGMIEKDAYCTDVLMQSAAVNAAVNAFNKALIAAHIRGCVTRDIRAGRDGVVDELVETLEKLMK